MFLQGERWCESRFRTSTERVPQRRRLHMPRPIRVLIVDDETLGRERIRQLLGDHLDVEVVGECENGLQAVDAIEQTSPDLVFLDVQMPELDGVGVLNMLGVERVPEVIFTTAHVEYMERAFEAH